MKLGELIAYLTEFDSDLEVKRWDSDYNDDDGTIVFAVPLDLDNIDVYDNEIIL